MVYQKCLMDKQNFDNFEKSPFHLKFPDNKYCFLSENYNLQLLQWHAALVIHAIKKVKSLLVKLKYYRE